MPSGTDPEPGGIRPSEVKLQSPGDEFTGAAGAGALGDFWAWGFSDLRDNIVRSVLAEYLVARAVRAKQQVRVGWANHDIEDPDGITIEVKAAGYLQSWPQRRLSTPRFDRLSGRHWNPDTGEFAMARTYRADVFVFAIQKQHDPSLYRGLDLALWEFHVVSAKKVIDRGTRSVGMDWVSRASGGPVCFEGIAAAVTVAAAHN